MRSENQDINAHVRRRLYKKLSGLVMNAHSFHALPCILLDALWSGFKHVRPVSLLPGDNKGSWLQWRGCPTPHTQIHHFSCCTLHSYRHMLHLTCRFSLYLRCAFELTSSVNHWIFCSTATVCPIMDVVLLSFRNTIFLTRNSTFTLILSDEDAIIEVESRVGSVSLLFELSRMTARSCCGVDERCGSIRAVCP